MDYKCLHIENAATVRFLSCRKLRVRFEGGKCWISISDIQRELNMNTKQDLTSLAYSDVKICNYWWMSDDWMLVQETEELLMINYLRMHAFLSLLFKNSKKSDDDLQHLFRKFNCHREKRLVEYEQSKRHARKVFSNAQRIRIACKQKYCCIGEKCQGTVLLPPVWELDHILPLCDGGSNEEDNVQMICSICHALKTQSERIRFRALERKHKYEINHAFVPAEVYYATPELKPETIVLSRFFYNPDGSPKDLSD